MRWGWKERMKCGAFAVTERSAGSRTMSNRVTLKKSIVSVHIFIVFMLPFVLCARAQSLDQETCDGPVYLASELSRRATITSRPDPAMTQEAVSHDVHGRVVIEAVLCHTGKVTDVLVIETLPDGMTEKAVESVRSTKFT